MNLVLPSQRYQASYIDYIAELGDEERYPFPLDFDFRDFDVLLNRLDDFANGRKLPEGFVPSSTLWLVDDGTLVGVTNIRHYLNDKIEYCGGHIGLGIRPAYRGRGLGKELMRLSIEKLVERGVRDIHIHCHKGNVASSRAITSNGGVLESQICVDGEDIERYRIVPQVA